MNYLGRSLTGARCAVVGIGVENLPLVEFLARRGAIVVACDSKTAAQLGDRYERLAALGVRWSVGPAYLEPLVREKFDYVFLTPGLIKDLPEIRSAAARGAQITGQMDLFLSFCPAPVIGISGSSGKSTTTTLIGDILSQSGGPVFVGGNIGRVLLPELDQITSAAHVVLELSSFQLEMARRSPQLAVLLNIHPNHLDIHGTLAGYQAAKENIYRWQQDDDVLVFAADEPAVAAVAATAPGRLVAFSRQPLPSPDGVPPDHWSQRLDGLATVKGDRIVFEGREGVGTDIMLVAAVPLLGRHNLVNVLAAVAVGMLRGIAPGAIAAAVEAFQPLAHRLEPVIIRRGVRYYNDSVATAPDRTAAALAAFTEPVVLLAGGYDKGIPFDGLGRVILTRPMRAVIVLGDTADAIGAAITAAAAATGQAPPPILRAASLDEAVRQADTVAHPGDVVLFSPASASYDMFPNFIVRGCQFKEAVRALH